MKELFEANFGNSKLKGIQEITLPEPISYTPHTIGWLILLIVGVIVALVLGYNRYRHWQANRYRTFALQRLAEIEQAIQVPETRMRSLRDLPVLVKQTALQAFPRDEIAQLSGTQWLGFLDSSGDTQEFTQGVGKLLPQLTYQSTSVLANLPEQNISSLIVLIRQWIKTHCERQCNVDQKFVTGSSQLQI